MYLRSKDLLFMEIGLCNIIVFEGGEIVFILNDCILKERLLFDGKIDGYFVY